MVPFYIRTFKIINLKLFIPFGKISIFYNFSDVIIKWRLNDLTTNVGTLKTVPLDSPQLNTLYKVKFVVV